MNKFELSQIKHISKEIKMLKKQIEYAECDVGQRMTTDSVTGSYSEFPWTMHSMKIHGVDIAGYENEVKRLKNRFSKRIAELIEKLEDAEKYIETIPDSELRMILSLRYVNGMKWNEIAERMGAEGDGSTQRKKHDRFMKVSRNSRK